MDFLAMPMITPIGVAPNGTTANARNPCVPHPISRAQISPPRQFVRVVVGVPRRPAVNFGEIQLRF